MKGWGRREERNADGVEQAVPGLREALRHARAAVPSDDQVRSLERRVAGLLATPILPRPPGQHAPAAATASTSATVAKLVSVVAVGGAIAVGGVTWHAHRAAPRTTVAEPAVPAPLLEEAPRAAAPSPGKAKPERAPRPSGSRRSTGHPHRTIAAQVAPTRLEATAPASATATVESAPVEAAPPRLDPAARVAPSAAVTEARLLARAQQALPDDPDRALALANEHASRFPHGSMEEEREAIAIDALAELRRTADARARAARFHARFPTSGYWRRLRGLLEEAPPAR